MDPTIPEKTEVEDKDNLTDDEKKEVKDKIEEANKDKFPEGTEVEVDDKGNATITYPDDSTDTIPSEDLVKEKEKEDKTIADQIDPTIPEKTGVKDSDNLTDKEKEEVKDKITEANKDKFPEGTDVSVDDKGNATITYPDGSKDTIPAEDLVFEYAHGEPEITDKPELKIADIIDPIIPDKTEVGRPGLTQSERNEVERKIIDANKDNFPEGTKVVVDESGNATIIYPDGSIDTIPWNKLVYHRDDEGAAESDKPADESSDKDSKGTEEASSTAKSSSGLLPETGETASTAIFGAAALSVLAGLGLVAKRREDEEA
ncbi:LPXTG-domain-containing protein cell wall anchor domain [Falseniella ignava CCUG 37419]|uniref:LPXTG-domain-containing protein cell wall anchor domain n=1 Tax=Falseniella ignava CCUG 37419 TaxID=883112 RepID=K1LNB2_9LACT|nr:LPXTG-domain-containing protein cell wall anchor domain [Falseniella ignava CCUG 37419]